MTYELNAYATTADGLYTVLFYENAEPSKEMNNRYFHVALKHKYKSYDFDAHFNTYENAKNLFKATVEQYGIKTVYISEAYLKWLTAEPNWDDEWDDEYANACMASNYGDDSLMERYNRSHGIEKDYSPSNPWDAPGMSVRDFI